MFWIMNYSVSKYGSSEFSPLKEIEVNKSRCCYKKAGLIFLICLVATLAIGATLFFPALAIPLGVKITLMAISLSATVIAARYTWTAWRKSRFDSEQDKSQPWYVVTDSLGNKSWITYKDDPYFDLEPSD
jgi:hypothetical protein